MDSLRNLSIDSFRNLEHKNLIITAVAGVPVLTFVYRRLISKDSSSTSRSLSSFPLPPGPKREPLIGSVRSFPQDRWYETFSAWQKTYGDMIYVNLMGTSMLVTNSLKIIKDLTEKRGHIYSGRQKDIMIHEVLGWKWDVVFADPGQFHTDCRAIMKRSIGQNEVVSQDWIIQKEAQEFVKEVSKVEGDPYSAILYRVGATMIKATYGESIYEAHGKEMTDINDQAVSTLTWAFTQFWFVNYIPILHYLPDWLPLPFKIVQKKGKAVQERVHYWPWEQTLKHYESGIAGPSIAMTCIESGKDLDVARDAIGIIFSAGVDNTTSSITIFFAYLLTNPDVQAKIHAELDREIPMGTTPTFTDRPQLKYMDAAWRESIRMNPPSPLGAPHVSLQADVYEGMYIPKGTLVFMNMGFMCRDERIWGADADVYRPERWLEPGAKSLPDVKDIVFGFGRRICPGQYFADRIGFTYVIALLKLYEIIPLEGETAPKEFTYWDSAIRRPEEFRCRFRPRHATH